MGTSFPIIKKQQAMLPIEEKKKKNEESLT
jgi:hypothetical protein